MNKSPAFQFYPADWLSDENVSVMDLADEGAYIRLLAYCWLEGSIPKNLEALKKLTKGGSTNLQTIVENCFTESRKNPDRLIHLRLEEERKKQQDWVDKCRQAGLKSYQLRRNKSKVSSTNPPTLVEQASQLNVNSSSSTSSSKEEKDSPPPSQKPEENEVEEPPFTPTVDEFKPAPNAIERIRTAHQAYCSLTGMNIPQRPEHERAWIDYLRTHNLAELSLVVRYLKTEIKYQKRNLGSLKFSNLVADLGRFEEDLALAKAQQEKRNERRIAAAPAPLPNPPKDKTPAAVVSKLLANLHSAAGMPPPASSETMGATVTP